MIFVVLLVLVGVGLLGVHAGRALDRPTGRAQTVADVVPADHLRAGTAAWYGRAAGIRATVAAAAAETRRDLTSADGMALRPACARLGAAADAGSALTDVPADSVGAGWTRGLTDYIAAATACGPLWDGTSSSPTQTLSEVTRLLDAGDAEWRAIAARLAVGH
jgi:hypothetical protein